MAVKLIKLTFQKVLLRAKQAREKYSINQFLGLWVYYVWIWKAACSRDFFFYRINIRCIRPLNIILKIHSMFINVMIIFGKLCKFNKKNKQFFRYFFSTKVIYFYWYDYVHSELYFQLNINIPSCFFLFNALLASGEFSNLFDLFKHTHIKMSWTHIA